MKSVKDVYFYTKDLTILYVEDDEFLLIEMKELFDDLFKKVVIAKNGIEALEIYKKDKFDILITDIKMPQMDGIELSRKIKNIDENQEIIIVSAYNESEKLLSLIEIGISDFILKPMEFYQLLNVLYKIGKNVHYRKNQMEFLIQQDKLAKMGEIVDLIAHQWLQFVNVLSLKTEMLSLENNNGSLNKLKLTKYIEGYSKEIEELEETLNEFRNFFKQKNKEEVYLRDLIKSCLVLVNDFMIKQVVEIENLVDDVKIKIYPNEFKQIILNILYNMVDNFEEREIRNRKITFYNDNQTLFIEDNGEGIDEDIQEFIFDDNFTTKEKGTGKGLYLSKMIIEKMGGTISLENTIRGVKFIIKVEDNEKRE